jgi:sporulation protein YlmC with PRC-barrel domain
MDDKEIPKKEKKEEKLWSQIKGYQVATNNARIVGVLEELIINQKTGRIVDIAVKIEEERPVPVKGARQHGEFLLIPFAKVEKVGEFIIVSE